MLIPSFCRMNKVFDEDIEEDDEIWNQYPLKDVINTTRNS